MLQRSACPTFQRAACLSASHAVRMRQGTGCARRPLQPCRGEPHACGPAACWVAPFCGNGTAKDVHPRRVQLARAARGGQRWRRMWRFSTWRRGGQWRPWAAGAASRWVLPAAGARPAWLQHCSATGRHATPRCAGHWVPHCSAAARPWFPSPSPACSGQRCCCAAMSPRHCHASLTLLSHRCAGGAGGPGLEHGGPGHCQRRLGGRAE